MPRFLAFAVCALLLVPLARAQSAAEILRDALDRYEAELAGVEDYTVTRSVMGTESTTYHERTDGAGPLDYTTYIVLPSGLHEAGDDHSLDSPYAVLDRIAESARYEGTQEVGGEAAHVVAVDDFGEIARDFNALPEEADGEFDIETLTLYLDTDSHRMLGMTMTGTMETEGRTSPVTMDTRFHDYRTVDGFTTPFRTTMEIQGMDEQMDEGEREEARRQLEEARRQMEAMPAEQRQMMERMMGDRLEQLEEMLGGDALSFEMAVTDVKVNTGRPN